MEIKKMESNVLNTNIGSPYNFFPDMAKGIDEQQILAGLFEQLLIFDCITVAVGRENFQLRFLIQRLGLNAVDRLVSEGQIKFLLWTPVIVTTTGRTKPNGKIDKDVIYGKPPYVSGTWGEEDLDPEKNIFAALDRLEIHKDRKKNFARKAVNAYTVPDGMHISRNATDIVTSAYESNTLAGLGLPYNTELNQLSLNNRFKLLDLGNKVLETAMLSEYNLKSYENYESYEICKTNLENIGRAYNVSENTSNLLKLSSLPDLKRIYLSGKMDFENVYRIRNYGISNYYRQWINNVGESANSSEVTEAYLKEIEGKHRWINSKSGMFTKNLFLFGIGEMLGNKLELITGAGSFITKSADYALGLLDEFVLGNLLKGRHPSMFIDRIANEIKPPATLSNP